MNSLLGCLVTWLLGKFEEKLNLLLGYWAT